MKVLSSLPLVGLVGMILHSIAPCSCDVTLKGCLSANCHAKCSFAIAACSKPKPDSGAVIHVETPRRMR